MHPNTNCAEEISCKTYYYRWLMSIFKQNIMWANDYIFIDKYTTVSHKEDEGHV